MKFTLLLLLSGFTFLQSEGQDINKLMNNLRYMKTDTLGCNAVAYWKIIALKRKAIPYLIEKLTDTTLTNISSPCKPTKLNVGEIAYAALDQIAEWPIQRITNIQFDLLVGDCWNFYNYLYDNSNKEEFKRMMKQWYAENSKKYIAVKKARKDQDACQRKYRINTYYRWVK